MTGLQSDDEVDEHALSYGYILVSQLHRIRVTDDGHTCFVQILPIEDGPAASTTNPV